QREAGEARDWNWRADSVGSQPASHPAVNQPPQESGGAGRIRNRNRRAGPGGVERTQQELSIVWRGQVWRGHSCPRTLNQGNHPAPAVPPPSNKRSQTV